MASLRKQIKKLSLPDNDVNLLIQRYLGYRGLGAATLRFFLNSLLKNRAQKKGCSIDLASINASNIIILCPKHVRFLGKLFQAHLKKLGINSTILSEEPKQGYSDHLHIVLCPQVFRPLPTKYIVYQLEQLTVIKSSWNASYRKILDNSVAVLDYSLVNINFLLQNGFSPNKVFYLPIFSKVLKQTQQTEFQHDVLFYGYLNGRRKRILDSLKNMGADIFIANNTYGDAMEKLITNSKIILNLHAKEDGMIESARLFECLSLNKVIISETGIDQNEYQYLEKGVIEFVPPESESQIMMLLNRILSPNSYQEKLDFISSKLEECFDYFGFFLAEFLYSLGLISFENFVKASTLNYPIINKNIRLQQYPACHEFSNSFPIVKHFASWLSDEMSIKFLTYVAKEQNLPYLIIDLNKGNSQNTFYSIGTPPLNYSSSHTLIKKGNILVIPNSCFDQILSWNELPRITDENNHSLLSLFQVLD